jgi:eukaryotic-like serine/threonine-protein kinase
MPHPQGAGKSLGDRFGKYELLLSLATGGTAEIFLAKQTGEAGFEKLVVVKRLLEHLVEDQEYVQMFLDEARLGARLAHPNIVQTLELGQYNGQYFIAMEYLAGLSLAQVMVLSPARVPGGMFAPELTLALLAQAASGLHCAHEAKLPDGTALKIVHRDVSPQNLIVTFEGSLKLVDFGIAHAAVRDAKTKTGMIKGKFAYMAPEQCLGKPLDRRTDIFALGVVAHEMLTGRRLFKRKSTYETYQAIVAGGPIPRPSVVNPALDPGVDELILPALSFDPDNRYATAEAFGEAMLNFLFSRGKRVASREIAAYLDGYFQPEKVENDRRVATGYVPARPQSVLWDFDDEMLELETFVQADEMVDEPRGQPTMELRTGGASAAGDNQRTLELRVSGNHPVQEPPTRSTDSNTIPEVLPSFRRPSAQGLAAPVDETPLSLPLPAPIPDAAGADEVTRIPVRLRDGSFHPVAAAAAANPANNPPNRTGLLVVMLIIAAAGLLIGAAFLIDKLA